MRLETVEDINRWMKRSGALSEALMRELCLVSNGYSGLSEVAQVRVASSGDGVRFEALWEGERRVEIECRRAGLTVPDAWL